MSEVLRDHSGLAYEIPLGEGATLTPEFDVLYSGDYLLSASAPNVIQEVYAKVDARITYRTDMVCRSRRSCRT